MTWLQRGTLATAVVVLALAALLVGRDGGDRQPAEPEATASPAATETLDQQIARVARIVGEVRGLEVEPLPDVTILSPGDLISRVGEDLLAYTEEDADRDRRMLSALGAIPDDFALRELLIESLSEQVAGFYDPRTTELVVGADDDTQRVGRVEEITLAHELQHALADRQLGLPVLDDADATDDTLLAHRSLVEGDATATMQAYAEVGFSGIDRLLFAQEALALQGQLAQVQQLPHHLQRSLTFPYEEGLAFVSDLRDRGGWEAVDAAYDQLPTSTAEILFPERYPAEPAEPVAEPGTPTPRWEAAHTASFGAADLLFLLEAPGGDPATPVSRAVDVVRGLADGRVDLWTDGDASLVSLTLATTDRDRTCQGLTTWIETWRGEVGEVIDPSRTRWSGDDVVTLVCGDTTRVGVGPDVESSNSVTRAADG